MLHDSGPSYVKGWREVETDWSQESMIMQLYNANQSGNPPYSYMLTPCWLQQAFSAIDRYLSIDRERAAAKAAAHG